MISSTATETALTAIFKFWFTDIALRGLNNLSNFSALIEFKLLLTKYEAIYRIKRW